MSIERRHQMLTDILEEYFLKNEIIALSKYLVTRRLIAPYEKLEEIRFIREKNSWDVTLLREENPSNSINKHWLLMFNGGDHNKSLKMKEIFGTKIEDLNFSTKLFNCLKAAKLNYVLDIVEYEESDLLEIRNLGEISLSELKQRLDKYGLRLNMKIEYDLYQEAKIVPGEDIDHIKIERLGLTFDTYQKLKKNEINTLGDIVDRRYDIPNLPDFRVRNFPLLRKKSKPILEILHVFEKFGLLSEEERKVLESKS